jgi:hypothetical protein
LSGSNECGQQCDKDQPLVKSHGNSLELWGNSSKKSNMQTRVERKRPAPHL